MAKGRRSRSNRKQAKAGDRKAPQPRSPRPQGEGSTDDVIDRIEALRSQVRDAQAEAESRDKATQEPVESEPKKSVAAAEGTAMMTAPIPEAGAVSQDETTVGAAEPESTAGESLAGASEPGDGPPAESPAGASEPVESPVPAGGPPAESPAGASGPGDTAPAADASAATARPGDTAPAAARLPVWPPHPPVRAFDSTLGAGPVQPMPELQPPYPRPVRSRGRTVAALAGLAVLVIVGVVIGLLASSNGGRHPGQTPVAAYLSAHVPAGTPVALLRPVNYDVPSAYPTVPVDASNLASAGAVHFAVAPDPLTSVGPVVSAYVRSHATLVAVDHGRASLWALGPGPASATTVAPTTVAPTTVAPTTVAPTTVPSTAAPTAVPATPVPATPVPATSLPAATVAPATVPPAIPGSAPSTAPAATIPATTPATAVPSTLPPISASAAPPPAATAPAAPSAPATTPTPATVTVQPGQSFWSIAQTVVQQRLGTTPTSAQVGQYWAALVAANTGHLPVPGNPNLIFSGTTVVLPAA